MCTEKKNKDELSGQIREKTYTVKCFTGRANRLNPFEINPFEKRSQTPARVHKKTYCLVEFKPAILRKVMDKLPFYRFNNLQRYFPKLSSISEFISSENFLKPIELELEGAVEQVTTPTNALKFEAALKVLNEISLSIQRENPDL